MGTLLVEIFISHCKCKQQFHTIQLIMSSYAASIASGTAAIIVALLVPESNPVLVNKTRSSTTQLNCGKYHKISIMPIEKVGLIDENQANATNTSQHFSIRITSVMLMCFISDFCVRWVQGTHDSRYAIFLHSKFGIEASTYA